MLNPRIILARALIKHTSVRCASGECGGSAAVKGLVLGAYQDECNPEPKLTPTAAKFDADIGGKLTQLIKDAGIKKGTARLFTNISNDYAAVAVGGLGPEGVGYNSVERLDECKENIRIATAHAARALQDDGITQIYVEPFTNQEAAAEAAILSVWRFQDFKNIEKRYPNPKVEPMNDSDKAGWERGKIKGENQNIARRIEETPGNMMTPTLLAEFAVDCLCPCGIQVEVRDRDWIESKRMYPFLAIAKGSCEPPLFLEIGYCGAGELEPPVILTGKGVTFDTGGLCHKSCTVMPEHRADVAGAAVCIATVKTAAQMSLPLNVIALLPLCENMIGGMSVKPGDVLMASNGKSVTVEHTDNEGRVMLIDALLYASVFKPCVMFQIATATNGARHCLGTSATAVFTLSENMWKQIERAGSETGDRVWRLPMWKIFRRMVTDQLNVDLHNVGTGGYMAETAKAASLPLEFQPVNDFLYMDINGTGMTANGVGHPYLREGTMSGRPTRTLSQFLYQIACPHTKGDDC
ncbi:hypothetical protein O3M35_006854 [Rhynocoris fuscipes]|uniref:Cytosol aminopeptidase n=1 Tax=Rhynocoris fuscipes TaxID=488301 RepID=A0AAW1DFJ4_9HEMI